MFVLCVCAGPLLRLRKHSGNKAAKILKNIYKHILHINIYIMSSNPSMLSYFAVKTE